MLIIARTILFITVNAAMLEVLWWKVAWKRCCWFFGCNF